VAPSLPAINFAVFGEIRRDRRNVVVIQKELPSSLGDETWMGLPNLDLGSALAKLDARREALCY
jgi:hypothetical protein